MKVNIDKIKSLAKEKGISISFLCEKVGMGRGYLNDIKKSNGGDIPEDRVGIITKILNTTIDYLTDKTDIKEKALPEQEEQKKMPNKLIELYNKLNSEGQDKLVSYADDLVTSGKYSNAQTFKIYRAAHSDTNKPAEIKRVGKDFAKTLEEAPETDEKF